jgi:hypothetical protein
MALFDAITGALMWLLFDEDARNITPIIIIAGAPITITLLALLTRRWWYDDE